MTQKVPSTPRGRGGLADYRALSLLRVRLHRTLQRSAHNRRQKVFNRRALRLFREA